MHISLIALLVRHWRVTIPILLLTLGACVFAQSIAPSAYRAVGTVMLATPASDQSRLPSAIIQLSAAIDEMQSLEIRESLAVGDASLSARLVDRTTLTISSTSGDAREAERSVTDAIQWLDAELIGRQERAGIPEADQLAGRLLTPTVIARRANDRTYTAEAVIWVDGLGGAEENPYNASPTTARFLIVALSGAEGRRMLEDQIGPGVSYSISQDATENLPGLVIVLEGSEEEQVLGAFDEVVGVMDFELNARQARAQVPLSRRVFIDVVARPEIATDESPTVHPLTLLVGSIGLGAAGGVGALDRRRRFRGLLADPVEDRSLPREELLGPVR